MPQVYISLGSNIEPRENLICAVIALSALGHSITCSPVYQSPAVGFSGDDFLNAAMGMHSNLSAAALTRQLKAIEIDQGRSHSAPSFSSRTLDLDLLLYGNETFNESHGNGDVVIPRPEMYAQAFVLVPLADIAGPVSDPATGVEIQILEERLQQSNPDSIKALEKTTLDLNAAVHSYKMKP